MEKTAPNKIRGRKKNNIMQYPFIIFYYCNTSTLETEGQKVGPAQLLLELVRHRLEAFPAKNPSCGLETAR